jgi:hypothetical protein
MKICNRCGGEPKPLSEFYKHAQMADGHLNICKQCKKGDTRSYQREKASDPEWAAREAERQREKEKRRYHEKLKDDPEHWKRHTIVSNEWRRRNPEKTRAHRIVARALRTGTLIRPSRCEKADCGGTAEHAHHEDYRKPLEVLWLCVECHALTRRGIGEFTLNVTQDE